MPANGINTVDNSVAIKAKIYDELLRLQLEPQLLMVENWIDVINNFPNGDEFEQAELGNATVRDYKEGEQIKYDGIDIGTRTFRINNYISSGHKVTKKFQLDSYLADQISAKIPHLESRAIMVDLEQKALKVWRDCLPTDSNNTLVNDFAHKFVAGYSSDATTLDYGVPNYEDFIYAVMALTKAGYTGSPVAIVSPYTAYLMQSSKFIKAYLLYQPMYQSIVQNGAVSGLRFGFNIGGVDVYVSNFTDVVTGELTLKSREQKEANSLTRTGNADVALVFINQPDRRPVRMAWRQMPTFEGRWDMDTQSELYSTIALYGLGVGESKNMVAMICKNASTTSFVAA